MEIAMISDDELQRVVAILGSAAAQDDEMEGRVTQLVGDSMLAQRLVEWIPEIFGFVLVSHIGKMNLAKTFSAKSTRGDWVEIPLDAEPICKAAAPIAIAMFHSGPREAFRNIAERSAIVDATNKALNDGKSIEGATWATALNGIPAEVYTGRKLSLWQRLFQ
jgi:hypothetical protein